MRSLVKSQCRMSSRSSLSSGPTCVIPGSMHSSRLALCPVPEVRMWVTAAPNLTSSSHSSPGRRTRISLSDVLTKVMTPFLSQSLLAREPQASQVMEHPRLHWNPSRGAAGGRPTGRVGGHCTSNTTHVHHIPIF